MQFRFIKGKGTTDAIFGRPFLKPFAHCYRTGLRALWPNGRIKMKLGMQIGLGPGHIVLDGDPAPPPEFSAHVYYSYCDFFRSLHSRYWFAQVKI